MTLEELNERVLQFDMLELPGQPQMGHMGTICLVHDLRDELLRYQTEAARLRGAIERHRRNVWGGDEVVHEEDARLYAALESPTQDKDAKESSQAE